MARAATAFVDFEGDFSKVGRSAGVQSKKLEGTFNSSFRRIASFAAGALAAIGVGRFLKSAFSEAEEAQKVSRQTAAVLKSTGGIAKVSAKQVDTLAQSLSNIAAVDDELIQAGQNVLLTFTNIRNEAGAGNDIFNQATTAALNLSAALGTDLQGSVIQVGKALNDPIKGVTALQRVGVSFTKQQRDQIKVLVESGKTLEAQKLILKELGTEFGGAAEAAATPSARFKVAIDNLKESLGGFLLPVFEKVASFMATTLVPALQDGLKFMQLLGAAVIIAFKVGFGGGSLRPIKGWLSIFAKLGALVRGFVDFIRGDVASAGVQLGKLFGLEEDDPRVKSMTKALGSIRKALVAVAQFIQRNWRPILIAGVAALLLFVAPVATIVAGLAFLYLRFKVVRDIVATVVVAVQAASQAIQGVVDAIFGFFRSHSEDFAAFGKQFADIGEAFVGVWNALVPLVRGALTIVIAVIVAAVIVIMALWDRFGKTILDKLRIAFNAIAQVVRGALQIVQGVIEIVTGIITLKWGKVWNGLKDVFGGVWLAMAGIVKFVINAIASVIDVGISAIAGVWSKAWDGFHSVVADVWGAILRTIGGAINIVIDIVNGLIEAFNRLPFVDNIDKLGHVNFAGGAPKAPKAANNAASANGTPKGRGFISPSAVREVSDPTGRNGRPINANVNVAGNVFGVDDLNAFADERDRKLALAMAAG